jgi:hypothetical protein
VAQWNQIHVDEARWSPQPEHEYSVSYHRSGGTWVVAYFAPGARTGEWLPNAGPADDGFTSVRAAADAAEKHWTGISRLRLVNANPEGAPWIFWSAVGLGGTLMAAAVASEIRRWRQARRAAAPGASTKPSGA